MNKGILLNVMGCIGVLVFVFYEVGHMNPVQAASPAPETSPRLISPAPAVTIVARPLTWTRDDQVAEANRLFSEWKDGPSLFYPHEVQTYLDDHKLKWSDITWDGERLPADADREILREFPYDFCNLGSPPPSPADGR